MSKENTKYRVDDTEYTEYGTLECSRGSGDSKESWNYTVLKDDSGTKYLLGEDGGKWSLYKEANLGWSQSLVATTHEDCPTDYLEGPGYSRRDTVMTWVRLKEKFADAEAPFQESFEAMVMDPERKPRVFMVVPLVILAGERHYLSARFPAEEHPRKELEGARLSPLGKPLEFAGGAGLIALLLWGAASGTPMPLRAFWWLGAISMVCTWFMERTGALHGLARLLAGAFFIHFATHGIDVHLSQDWEEIQAIVFESTRAALLLGVLLIIRLISLRVYAVLTDGGLLGGGCAWWVFVCGIAMVSLSEEFSYFPFFSWYAGSMPYGLIWPVFLAIGIWHDWDDYKTAPLGKREMKSSLFKVTEILEQGVQAVSARAEELAFRCDDLEDAVKISNDPAVVSLFAFGPCFLKLRDALNQLKETNLDDLSPYDTELIDEDLKTTGRDLKELLEKFRSWGTSDFDSQSIRVSSFLLTREH